MSVYIYINKYLDTLGISTPTLGFI